MSEYIFKLPDLGEGTVESEIGEWFIKVGDLVTEETVVGTVMTDKAAVEVSSPVTGTVVKLAGLPGTATGRVADNGAVSVNLKVFGVTATVRGRLTGGVGAGDWSSNSAICAKGGWRAAQSGN